MEVSASARIAGKRADKLLNIKVGGNVVKSFSYDFAGRTTGITDAGGTTTFGYDYEDRVTSISRPGMTTNAFSYNGFGGRVAKSDSGGTTTYLRSGASVVAPVVSVSGATYTPGVSEKRGGSSTYYHSDIKNSVEQTDSSQTISASQQYDAFGNLVSSSGGTWNGPFAYGGRFGYQSDGDYDLKHLGARYYDSSTGRFLSRDPIRDGRNWYVYCGNDPIANADPLGLKIVILASPKDEEKIREHLGELKRNPATKQMMYELINSPKVIVITITPSLVDSKFVSPDEVIPDNRRIRSGILWYNPDEVAHWPLAEAYLPHYEAAEPVHSLLFTPEIVLVHELGHAYGYGDPGVGDPEPGDTVNKVENPFRKTIGVRLRHMYFIRRDGDQSP